MPEGATRCSGRMMNRFCTSPEIIYYCVINIYTHRNTCFTLYRLYWHIGVELHSCSTMGNAYHGVRIEHAKLAFISTTIWEQWNENGMCRTKHQRGRRQRATIGEQSSRFYLLGLITSIVWWVMNGIIGSFNRISLLDNYSPEQEDVGLCNIFVPQWNKFSTASYGMAVKEITNI